MEKALTSYQIFNQFFKEMYRNILSEFVCGRRCVKGQN